MIEVKIKVSDIDYGAAADVLLPVLLDKLSASANPFTAGLLTKLKGLSGSAAKAALSILPQDVKDELAVACLNHYSDGISQSMVNFVEQKGIGLQISGVGVSKE